jgi:signal transduction histidine kinase
MTAESVKALQARLEIRERQINAMHQISAALFSKTSLDDLLRETLTVSLQTVEADAGSILLYDSEKNVLVFRYVIGGATELVGREFDPHADVAGNASRVFRTGQALITPDTSTTGHNPRFDNDTGYVTKNMLTVPLKNMNETIGVMQALNRRAGKFDHDDQELLEIVSSLASTSIVNATLAQEAQLAAVARAVGDLGHDIKNALTPIETMIDTTVLAFMAPMFKELDELAASWQESDPEKAAMMLNHVQLLRDWYPEMQGSVQDGCADIREMVSEIADYIKGAQATHFEEHQLDAVIQERLRRLMVLARNRRVTLHLDDMTAVPSFPFDNRLLGRAIFNLVNNALGAINDAVKKKKLEMRPGGFNIRIGATAVTEGTFPDGNYCRITVEDDGPGIPPEVKETLFTTRTISTTPGGTGIGTRFIKSVADAHHGTVGVISELGCGACFWIKLPLTRDLTATA